MYLIYSVESVGSRLDLNKREPSVPLRFAKWIDTAAGFCIGTGLECGYIGTFVR
jgi:hypothetical protein